MPVKNHPSVAQAVDFIGASLDNIKTIFPEAPKMRFSVLCRHTDARHVDILVSDDDDIENIIRALRGIQADQRVAPENRDAVQVVEPSTIQRLRVSMAVKLLQGTGFRVPDWKET